MNPLRTLRIFALLAGPALALLCVTWLTQLHPKAAPASRVSSSGVVATPTNPAERTATESPASHGGSTATVAPTAVAPHEAGMVVGIDPETGKMGPPTAEQRAELDQIAASQNALLSRSTAGLTEEHRADGTVHVNLQGRFQEYATVRIGPDGTKTFGCVEDTTGISKSATETATSAQPVAAAHSNAVPALEER